MPRILSLYKAFSLFQLPLSYFPSVTFYLSICLPHAKWSYSILALGFLLKTNQRFIYADFVYLHTRLCAYGYGIFIRVDMYPIQVENTLIWPWSIGSYHWQPITPLILSALAAARAACAHMSLFSGNCNKMKINTKPYVIFCIHQFSQLGTPKKEQVTSNSEEKSQRCGEKNMGGYRCLW